MFKILKVKTADVFHLKLRVLFVNLLEQNVDASALCPIPRFQAIFSLFLFLYLLVLREEVTKDCFHSNFTVGGVFVVVRFFVLFNYL